jgi:hypothetical protein
MVLVDTAVAIEFGASFHPLIKTTPNVKSEAIKTHGLAMPDVK